MSSRVSVSKVPLILNQKITADGLPAILPTSQIPKILHQSWKDNNVPERFHKWMNTWADINPDYQLIFWTDETNRNLVSTHYPWFLSTYDSLPHGINRADAVRYCYLHKYGGVYSDIDLEALKPLSDLFSILDIREKKIGTGFKFGINVDDKDTWSLHLNGAVRESVLRPQVLLPLMSGDVEFAHNIPNAWMASVPEHSFWIFLLKLIKHKMDDGDVGVESLTGPVVLKEAIRKWETENVYNTKEKLSYVPPGVIFPYDWRRARKYKNKCAAPESEYNAEECKKLVVTDESYAITYWTHSWGKDVEEANKKNKS